MTSRGLRERVIVFIIERHYSELNKAVLEGRGTISHGVQEALNRKLEPWLAVAVATPRVQVILHYQMLV
jgi:hypothetical protein